MLTKTIDALESQAVLTKAIATLEAGATLTEAVAALEHAETLDMMRPDDHLRAEESNGATTAHSDGADFERLEIKDRQAPTTEGDTPDHARDGGGDKVWQNQQPVTCTASLSCTTTQPALCAPPGLSSLHGHNTTPVWPQTRTGDALGGDKYEPASKARSRISTPSAIPNILHSSTAPTIPLLVDPDVHIHMPVHMYVLY